jgi:L-asparaginase
MTQTADLVDVTPLERDERVDLLPRLFGPMLQRERAYAELPEAKRKEADAALAALTTMRFETREALEAVARTLLAAVSPGLANYIPIAMNAAAQALPSARGVLVIYTGGTIGSAPKDREDPESPQVVRPWQELKAASPQLGLLGYPVDAISFREPLDSCNVGPRHWRTMVSIIQQHYADYEGFVILHGTDSMVYTASALSFMLLDLSKPVVLTGAQVAGIVNPRNDAHQNMITAIMLANPRAHGQPIIPEVVVAFGNRIVRGNRAKKMNVVGYQGFDSPNYPALGEAGEFITIDRKQIRSVPETDLQVYDQLDTNVIMLEVFPGMQHSPILSNILQDQQLRGVVLKSYGAGNIPTDPPFLNLFRDFIRRGGVVVNVTSVPEGKVVMGLYETSQVLVDRGLIGGFDLTPEAAMCKLMMLLGTYEKDVTTVKRLMQRSVAGEQTLSLEVTTFPGNSETSAGGSPFVLPKQELQSIEEPERIDKVMLRFTNACLETAGSERATVRLSLDDGSPLGAFRRGKVPEGALVKDDTTGESLAIDLSTHKDRFVAKAAASRGRPLKASQRVGFSVQLEGSAGARFTWQSAELHVYYQD